MNDAKDLVKESHEKRRLYQSWIDSLEVGDEVAVDYGRGRYEITKIEKISKTRRFTLKTGLVYRNDGSSFKSWTGGNLTAPSKAVRKRIKQNNMLSAIASATFSKLSYEDVEKIYKILYPENEASS